MGSKNEAQKKKKKKKKNNNNNSRHEHGGGGEKIIEDRRFASVHSDPRFQRVPKHKSKVAIDSRFNRMFTDKSFASSSAPLDKRGKPNSAKPETSLRHYYRFQEEQEQEEEREERKQLPEEDKDIEEPEEDSESEELAKLDGSRSESDTSESSDDAEGDESESTTDEEDDLSVVFEDDTPDVEVENVEVTEEGTRRLAVVGMDWRHVRAVDLYAVLHSFLPKGGEIVSVTVYPSEFGIQRMKEEEIHGPVGLFESENRRNGEDDDEEEDINYESLRDYEQSRLRYYYAVAECDSIATAEHLYKGCDGLEFERSSNVLDLRFIPDSMEFKHQPRDVATEVPTGYEGLDFHTKALQHSNIPISWDEDEPQRVKTLKRKFNADQLSELELKEFLASDESESEDYENDDAAEDKLDKKHKKQDKYRALIQSGDGSDGDGEEEGQDMEITFNTGLEEISKRILEKRAKGPESVWEAELRKQREKKKARKNRSKNSTEDESGDTDEEGTEQADDFFIEEPSVKKGKKKDAHGKGDKAKHTGDLEAEASRAELELLVADDNGTNDGLRGYNLKAKKAKGKGGKEVLDEDKLPSVDYDDARFSALFTSPLFALDPTDPQFKRSAAYARQVAQRQREVDQQEAERGEHRRVTAKAQLLSDVPITSKDEVTNSDGLPSNKEKHELSSLLRSIKTKSKQAQSPSICKKPKKVASSQPSKKEGMLKPELSTLVQSVKKKAKADF